MRRVLAVLVLGALLAGTVPAREAEPSPQAILDIACNSESYPALEFSYSDPTCWMHGGHHTYFLGQGTTYLFRGLTGRAFSVEQQFSAPTEDPAVSVRPTTVVAADAPVPDVRTPLPVELSLDGVTWTKAGEGHYGFLPASFTAGTLCTVTGDPCPSLDGLTRQNVFFDVGGQGQEFRFLRIRQPASDVTHGLSGFLDHTDFRVAVDPGRPDLPPSYVGRQRDLACERAMEAILAAHPCWFGGLDRYDAASFLHTWYLGDTLLDRVRANFTVLPWRTDDFFVPALQQPPLVMTTVTAQVSVDGATWTNLTTVQFPFGQGVLEAEGLGGVPAKLLRLVPQEHARFHQFSDFPPNHHPRGYFVASAAHIEGLMAQ